MDASQGSPQINLRRYAPDEPLPPYSYVTGKSPHPTRDPAGHSFGSQSQPCEPPVPDGWRECHPYLFGLDLFNYGYYWEAHEVWESVWIACGRGGTAGDFIKGLIKLAAAGVKAREGRCDGVRSHARRAAELFRQTVERLPARQSHYFGLPLAELCSFAAGIDHGAVFVRPTTTKPVEIVFSLRLQPVDDASSPDAALPAADDQSSANFFTKRPPIS